MPPVPLDFLAALSLFLGFYAKAIGALVISVLALVLVFRIASKQKW